MTTIRSLQSVPTPSARRVPPADQARGSNDRPPQRENALVPVPTQRVRDARKKSAYRARNAAAEVLVQVIAGPQQRGLKAETSELDRYRRAYAQATTRTADTAPVLERRA